MKHARGKRILAAFLSVAMMASVLSTQVFAAEMPENTSPAVTLDDGVKPTLNKPKRALTDANVEDMQIALYASGTETLNPNGSPFQVSGNAGTVGTDNVAYEIGEMYGNDVDGYYTDVTFHFAHGDKMEINGRAALNRHPTLKDYPEWQGDWIYDFSQCEADQTVTMKYMPKINKWYVNGYNNGASAVAIVVKVYMKLPGDCTVTYTDGVDDEVLFEDQSYTVKEGSETPDFVGTPTRENWVFTGWSPAVSDTVTGDVTYVAQWEKATAHKPTKKVTASDVSKMEIRFYGTGTEVLNPNDEPYSLGGTSGKVGTGNVAYEIGEIYGNDVDGYFVDIDFHFAHGDKMEANGSAAFNRHPVLKNYPEWQGNWVYDFSKCDADQTLTLSYESNKWVVPGSNNMKSAVANVIQVYMKITPYTVTYTDGVADEEIFADESYTVGEGSLTPAFTGTTEREGYTFAGWDKTVADVVTENVTYTAVWTANTYTLTLDAGEGTVDPATVTVTYDAAVGELPVPTRDGYDFAGWADENGTVVTADTVYTVAGDSTLTATWTAKSYTLTLDAGEGTVDPATVTVTYDTAVGELPVPTRDGYEFAGWTDENGAIVTADTVYMTAGDSTLTAQWEEIPEEPGTVDPEDPDDTQNPDDPQKPGDGTQDPGDNTQGSGDDTQKPGDTENVDDNDVPQSGADNNTTNNTPQTGDESSLALLLTMLLASAAGFGVMGLRRREEK